MELVQFMWEHGTIPSDLVWTIFILIHKGNVDNQGIGILEVLWKVMEAIIDALIKKAVASHDVLHGFCVGGERGNPSCN